MVLKIINRGVGFHCSHWLHNTSVVNGINTPPVISSTGGGWEGYLCTSKGRAIGYCC